MPRTTIDIDPSVLGALKRRARQEEKTLGRLTSELLAPALAARAREDRQARPQLRWLAEPMGARLDLEDDDAIHGALGGR